MCPRGVCTPYEKQDDARGVYRSRLRRQVTSHAATEDSLVGEFRNHPVPQNDKHHFAVSVLL